MNPTPDIASANAMFALSTAVGLISVLVGVIWTMLRNEVKSNNEALSRKASNAELEEVKKDYKERLSVLAQKQDREIDWLKQELHQISQTQIEMRREANTANNAILAHLRNLAGTRSTT